MPWFEIEKSIPDGRYPCLLWDGEHYGIGIYNIDMNEWDIGVDLPGEPTHWTYLPAPPM